VTVRAAPRYDPRLVDAIRALDEPGESIAQLWRRVGAVADVLRLTRPSYVHLRRLVHVERALRRDERERRAAIRRILLDAGGRVLVGRFVDAYEVAEAVDDVRRRSPT
jgi:predicted NAD-dependent protein-ADP-ribosyltransferase YbiA (DUF1768 family)